MSKQRISFFPFDQMDSRMQEEMERCAREGTPRPESSAVRAHAPNAFWAFADSWQAIFYNGIVDHTIKELCRLYISQTVQCDFCGNQRSEKATTQGLLEQKFQDLINFEASSKYSEREKSALAYTEAIAWRLDTDDAFWERLYDQFSEPELVELGCFVALTYGQQSMIRILNLKHQTYMPGSDASLAPHLKTGG
jgi:alkylhydroperoxidase family enzyme